jgi:predicted dehydrogenase
VDLYWIIQGARPADDELISGLRQLLHQAGWRDAASEGVASAVLLWAGTDLDEVGRARLAEPLQSRIPVFLLGPTAEASQGLAEAAGVVLGSSTPPHSARLRATGQDGWIDRVSPLGDPLELTTSVTAVEKTGAQVEVWFTAQLGLTTHPVLTWNPETHVGAFTVAPDPSRRADVADWARLLHLALRRAQGSDPAGPHPPVGVGLLGFGAIGAEHASAITTLPGLRLAAVCDRSPERLASAAQQFAGVATTMDPHALLAADDVQLVIVSTPPDSHADWAIRVMEAGKDVVVEKPFALTVEAADSVLLTSQQTGRRVVVYQNRRFDPDFVTLRALVEAGRLGEVFHIETFIGGYGHPCNYWHSDEEVSGGAIYDWGSHVLDQILSLHPSPIDHVTCVEHKRRWHDVTNADHTSMTIRYRDGAEASFVHSDLAAALKPRWYVLGTEAGVTSTWRQASVVARSAIGTLDEDVLAVTDSPPELVLVDADGSQTAVVAQSAPALAFHRQLADALVVDWPMSVTAEQSRRVVAVMEAARISAQGRGRPVPVDGEP